LPSAQLAGRCRRRTRHEVVGDAGLSGPTIGTTSYPRPVDCLTMDYI
jgi:hypothetical protein